jgi:hypothetical protein
VLDRTIDNIEKRPPLNNLTNFALLVSSAAAQAAATNTSKGPCEVENNLQVYLAIFLCIKLHQGPVL